MFTGRYFSNASRHWIEFIIILTKGVVVVVVVDSATNSNTYLLDTHKWTRTQIIVDC